MIQNTRSSRLFFIDHLRSLLMVLVVLHHVALVYGASLPGYYYVEPPFDDPQAFSVLMAFTAVNQSWFMGAFFLLAGYFTPPSFDRKGPGPFLKDRLLRLGIPLLVFFFVLSPISFIGYYLMPAELSGITEPLTWQRFWKAYPDWIGLGPLWFVAMLLIFGFGYAIWRMLTRYPSSDPRRASLPSYGGIGVFVLALAGASYLLRIIIPLGESVLQFPTLAYLAQYLGFFAVGAFASRRDWFQRLPAFMGVVGFLIAAAAAVFMFPLATTGQWFTLAVTPALDNAMGNGQWQSAVYALWDSLCAVGMGLALITFFRRYINGRGRIGRFLSGHNYAVYVVHIPIVVILTHALRRVELASLLKFGLASLIVVPSCYLVAYVIRKIPLAAQIL
jgi:hypothetical protein